MIKQNHNQTYSNFVETQWEILYRNCQGPRAEKSFEAPAPAILFSSLGLIHNIYYKKEC